MSTSASLTLDAYHAIYINAPISITGAGGLNLYVNDGGTGGDYSFGSGANVDYGATNNDGTLSISKSGGAVNAASYELLYSTTDVQNINNDLNSGLFPNYALATSLDATGVSGWVPIGVDGSGNALNGVMAASPASSRAWAIRSPTWPSTGGPIPIRVCSAIRTAQSATSA